jgi:hypothetical protein
LASGREPWHLQPECQRIYADLIAARLEAP